MAIAASLIPLAGPSSPSFAAGRGDVFALSPAGWPGGGVLPPGGWKTIRVAGRGGVTMRGVAGRHGPTGDREELEMRGTTASIEKWLLGYSEDVARASGNTQFGDPRPC